MQSFANGIIFVSLHGHKDGQDSGFSFILCLELVSSWLTKSKLCMQVFNA